MNNTKISCILVLLAIVVAIIMWIEDKPSPQGVPIIPLVPILLLLVLSIIIITGLVFSIKAIITDKTVLSWICAIAFASPILGIAVIAPTVGYFQDKADRPTRFGSPQSPEKREKIYRKYNLPDSLDISVRYICASASIVDYRHHPIMYVVNFGDGFWFLLSEDDAAGDRFNISLAKMIELDKSTVPLLTTLPAKHYATRKDAKSSWITGEYNIPPPENENEDK